MQAIDYYYKGIESFKNRNYKDAVKYFEISNNIDCHYKSCEMLFRCYVMLSQFPEAYKYIRKAYDINPKNDKVTLEYAESAFKAGNTTLAEKLLSEILQRNPTYKPAENFLNEISPFL